MAGGSSLPYALRHNKFVDRRIFVDLLTRIDRWHAITDYLYLSMGGTSLEDHKLVHSHFGITKLFSIDESDKIVKRQIFNKPIAAVQCVEMSTSDLAARFRTEIESNGFEANTPVIVWLDYTKPADIAAQVSEFIQILDTMSAGDVVRVTINAHPPSLKEARELPVEQRGPEPLALARLQKLKERLGMRLPEDTGAERMTPEELPKVLAEIFYRAALEALQAEDPNMFEPLSAVRYADGQQMLSLTGIVLAKGEAAQFREATAIGNWPFASAGWHDIVDLNTPELTLRERLFLDQIPLSMDLSEVRDRLGFDFDGKEDVTKEVIEQYRRNGRFYPHFHYVPT